MKPGINITDEGWIRIEIPISIPEITTWYNFVFWLALIKKNNDMIKISPWAGCKKNEVLFGNFWGCLIQS